MNRPAYHNGYTVENNFSGDYRVQLDGNVAGVLNAALEQANFGLPEDDQNAYFRSFNIVYDAAPHKEDGLLLTMSERQVGPIAQQLIQYAALELADLGPQDLDESIHLPEEVSTRIQTALTLSLGLETPALCEPALNARPEPDQMTMVADVLPDDVLSSGHPSKETYQAPVDRIRSIFERFRRRGQEPS